MASDKSPKKIKVTAVKPVQKERTIVEDFEYEPAPETEMDFQTVEDDKKRKKNITIGVIIGILLAAALIAFVVYSMQQSKIANTPVTTTTVRVTLTTKPGSEETTIAVPRHYATSQLTVHKDQNGIWRSYAGLEQTVGYTGIVSNDSGWWYVENDVVNFKFNGIASNDYGSWIVENGKVNLKYSGDYVYDGHLYKIQNGKVVSSTEIKATTTAKQTTAKDSSTTATTVATPQHEHHWVSVYSGNAETRIGTRTSACKCLDCGLLFDNAELLEAHCVAEGHELKRDDDGALAAEHILGKDEVGDSEVITGYDKPEETYWVCTICNATTTNPDDLDFVF